MLDQVAGWMKGMQAAVWMGSKPYDLTALFQNHGPPHSTGSADQSDDGLQHLIGTGRT
jgi:hypothetical protein